MVLGSKCQPCHCHGNTDPNMLFTDCHPLTGECLNCMHNTAGLHCDVCAPGFYGDAVTAKNCTSERLIPKPRSRDAKECDYFHVAAPFRVRLLSLWNGVM